MTTEQKSQFRETSIRDIESGLISVKDDGLLITRRNLGIKRTDQNSYMRAYRRAMGKTWTTYHREYMRLRRAMKRKAGETATSKKEKTP